MIFKSHDRYRFIRGGDISIITFAHHKGGTGKTTSCLNISGFLTKKGYNVLVVDIDPQANATAGLGIDPNFQKTGMYDIFMSCIPGYPKVDLEEIIIKTGSGIDLAPSSLETGRCRTVPVQSGQPGRNSEGITQADEETL